jgi:hypothetical protein
MQKEHFTDQALAMQGFQTRSDPKIRQLEPWLRLTPSLSTLWIATGTLLGSARGLLGFSLISALGAARRKHPFDMLYDRAFRRLRTSPPLPDNPAPRRFAMATAAAWAALAAALLRSGHRRTGRIAGGLLALSGATVASTHFCFGSWTYQMLRKLRLTSQLFGGAKRLLAQ